MRTLKFIVDGQIVTLDPNCDFSNLVPGSEGYLRAEFIFSPEWRDCVKVASFWSAMGEEFKPQILNDNACMIPAEATKRMTFRVQVLGKKNGYKIITNKVDVNQTGGIIP